jgi:acetolactate synthase I/II/III large subunit
VTKLSDYIADFLAAAGVRHVFLLPGGGCMHMADSIGKHPQIEHVSCLHEQACAFAAEAYAEYATQLGVALVTTGPGGTNTVTGVACSWMESSSCLFLSGQAKRADLIGERCVRSMGQQEVDCVSIVRPITKYAVTVMDPASIRYHLEKAVYLATHGRRGPVWVEVPLDVQAIQIDPDSLEPFLGTEEVGLTDDEVDDFRHTPFAVRHWSLVDAAEQAAAIINRAQRPALFVGNGVRTAGAEEELRSLIERLQVPVLLTWKAMDLLPDDHPLNAGRPGAIGQRAANFTQQNADCMLILGARLDLPQTAFNHANFAPAAEKILVDVDAAEIAKMQTEIHLPVCADVRDFLRELLRQPSLPISPSPHLPISGDGKMGGWGDGEMGRSTWVQRVQEWKSKYPVVLPEYWTEPKDCVSMYVLIDVLSDALGADDLIVPGSSGPCSDIFMQVFRAKAGQRILNAPGLGAMGTGLPATIGACLASGGRRTICVNGDGGFQLNIQELETLRRLDLPIKIFVLDNGSYGSIMAMQRNYFQGRLVGSDADSGLTLPDVGRIAEAYRLPTARIASHDGLRESVAAVLDQPGPVICAVKVSAAEKTAPRVTSELRSDGVLVSKPMEDMWPFLDREELKANMTNEPCAERIGQS